MSRSTITALALAALAFLAFVPNVALSAPQPPTKDVIVANDASNPVPVAAQPVREPFQQYFHFTPGNVVGCSDPLAVPEGKILTVESLNWYARLPAGEPPNVYLSVSRTQGNTISATFLGTGDFVEVRPDPNDAIDDWRGTTNLTLSTADVDGMPIAIFVCASGKYGNFSEVQGYVTGYLE